MPAGRGNIAGGASIILFGAAPVLVYHLTGSWHVSNGLAMTRGSGAWLVGAVAAIQIAAIAWVLGGKWTPRTRVALVIGMLATGAAVVILTGPSARTAGLVVAGGCHAVAYCGLLVWFGASLRAGREPVVTGFARRVRRTMPDKVMRYTRLVTIAWCVFFAAQLIVSATLLMAALLAGAPVAAWSGFVNLLNLPLLAAMFLGEMGWRLILFRHEPRTGLIDTLSAVRRARVMPASRP
jgi:uncharacterized membrane protein